MSPIFVYFMSNNVERDKSLIWTSDILREELGIILSPKASIEGAKSRANIGGGFENLFRDGKLGLILSPEKPT